MKYTTRNSIDRRMRTFHKATRPTVNVLAVIGNCLISALLFLVSLGWVALAFVSWKMFTKGGEKPWILSSDEPGHLGWAALCLIFAVGSVMGFTHLRPRDWKRMFNIKPKSS